MPPPTRGKVDVTTDVLNQTNGSNFKDGGGLLDFAYLEDVEDSVLTDFDPDIQWALEQSTKLKEHLEKTLKTLQACQKLQGRWKKPYLSKGEVKDVFKTIYLALYNGAENFTATRDKFEEFLRAFKEKVTTVQEDDFFIQEPECILSDPLQEDPLLCLLSDTETDVGLRNGHAEDRTKSPPNPLMPEVLINLTDSDDEPVPEKKEEAPAAAVEEEPPKEDELEPVCSEKSDESNEEEDQREEKSTGKPAKSDEKESRKDRSSRKSSRRSEKEEKITGKSAKRDEKEEKITGKSAKRDEKEEKITGKSAKRDEKEEKSTGKSSKRDEKEEKSTGKSAKRDEKEEKSSGKSAKRDEEESSEKSANSDEEVSVKVEKSAEKPVKSNDQEAPVKKEKIKKEKVEISATTDDEMTDSSIDLLVTKKSKKKLSKRKNTPKKDYVTTKRADFIAKKSAKSDSDSGDTKRLTNLNFSRKKRKPAGSDSENKVKKRPIPKKKVLKKSNSRDSMELSGLESLKSVSDAESLTIPQSIPVRGRMSMSEVSQAGSDTRNYSGLSGIDLSLSEKESKRKSDYDTDGSIDIAKVMRRKMAPNPFDSDDAKSDSSHSDSSLGIGEVLRSKMKHSFDPQSIAKAIFEFDEAAQKSSKAALRDKLLIGKLSSTDSSEEERKWKEKKSNDQDAIMLSSEDDDDDIFISKEKAKHKAKKGKKNKLFSSDDDIVSVESDEKDDQDSDKSSSSVEVMAPKKRKRRIQKASDSDSDEGNDDNKTTPDSGLKGRKKIRKVLKEESLEQTTKEAQKAEQERKKRISERQAQYNKLINDLSKNVEKLDKLVLDFDPDKKKELISVHPALVDKLKPHQAEGVKFMWDACFESLKDAEKSKGSGCILAHCMGLGKTLQVIALVHTLLSNSDRTKVKTVLICCPLSTVLNWTQEFRKWLDGVEGGDDIDVFHMSKTPATQRQFVIREWHSTGGVLVLGYNLFRGLVLPSGRQKKSAKEIFSSCLLDPGPDLVICDEGHVLKNESTAISKAMSKIKSLRRIALTGTPLQNNLIEYHCMVQFVKPSLLGTRKEYKNQFVNPITNGQFEDSTAHDVKVMKRRAHVLHKLLDGVVQRKDYNVLKPYLPPKFEYVISIALSEVQIKLYRHYLENLSQRAEGTGTKTKTAQLFGDWQTLSRVCCHPRALLMHSERKENSGDEDEEGSLKDFIDDGPDGTSESSSSSGSESSKSGSDSSVSGRKGTRATRSNPLAYVEDIVQERRSEWWSEIVSEEEIESIATSSKFLMLFAILKKCEDIGDKLLVFSQSLYTLDLIEYFLSRIHDDTVDKKQSEGLLGYQGSWLKGLDYYRLDGSTSSELRATFIKNFNRDEGRSRLFLISTKAGGMGVNLVGANRIVLFDCSWNPSHDVQSIFRIYRFGQLKPCYIYRFLAQGCMEEKVYERQVAKLSIACRVIDEQQIDRHFSHSDLNELYTFSPKKPDPEETPVLPKDRLMAEILQTHGELIVKHHQHDSLLDHIEEEELNEEERQAAWADFENEKNQPVNQPGFVITADPLLESLEPHDRILYLLRQRNPFWTEEQLYQTADIVMRQQGFRNPFVGGQNRPPPPNFRPQMNPNFFQRAQFQRAPGMPFQQRPQMMKSFPRPVIMQQQRRPQIVDLTRSSGMPSQQAQWRNTEFDNSLRTTQPNRPPGLSNPTPISLSDILKGFTGGTPKAGPSNEN